MANKISRLYDDRAVVEFIGDDNRHDYYLRELDGQKLDDEKLINVSSVLDIKSKPFLVKWKQETTLNYFIEQIKKDPLVIADASSLDNLRKDALNEPGRIRNNAASLGTGVHKWIEDYVKSKINGTSGHPVRPARGSVCIDSFLEWEDRHKVVFIFSERMVLSLKYKYVGTLDIGAIVDGRSSIVDIKTSNGMRKDYYLQTGGYLGAIREEKPYGYQPDNRIHLILPKDEDKKIAVYSRSTEEEHIKDMEGFINFRGGFNWEATTSVKKDK